MQTYCECWHIYTHANNVRSAFTHTENREKIASRLAATMNCAERNQMQSEIKMFTLTPTKWFEILRKWCNGCSTKWIIIAQSMLVFLSYFSICLRTIDVLYACLLIDIIMLLCISFHVFCCVSFALTLLLFIPLLCRLVQSHLLDISFSVTFYLWSC